jgi:hypothetical protein
MEAIDSAEGPEIEHDHLAAKVGQFQWSASIEPLQTIREIGCSHGSSVSGHEIAPFLRQVRASNAKGAGRTGADANSVTGGLLLEVIRVDLQVLRPLLRKIIFEEDRLDRAHLGTDTAVDAFVWIDEIHLRVIIGMNAINRADLDT